MMKAILNWMEAQRSMLGTYVGDVLEVGSYNVNGTVRDVLEETAKSYIGTDMREGPCVDLALDAELVASHFGKHSFDTVVCCECLEHTLRPWIIVDALKHVLKPGGHLWISTPTFGFPEHRFPIDCYRFGEDAYRGWMFTDTNLLAMARVYDAPDHPALVAVGQKHMQ
jgi:SAM-dependent methyltransferase